MSISQYEVLEAGTPDALAALVATAIAAGWQPFGPPVVRKRDTSPQVEMLCQGMTKGTPVAAVANDVAEIVTATNVIDASETGSVFFLNSATEFVSTLPAPALGLKFSFIVMAAPSGASYTVVSGSSANIIKGLQNSVAGDAGDFGTADDTITFVDGQAVAGDRVDVISDGTSWYAYARSKLAAGITFTQAS